MSSSEYLPQLVRQIESQLDWGAGVEWTNRDFQQLSERIFEQTRKQLSVTTLKRVWGRAERVAQPSIATLDILAEFAGYDSWRVFRQKNPSAHSSHLPHKPASKVKGSRMLIGTVLLLVILLSMAWYATKDKEAALPDPSLVDRIQFSFEKVTSGYPNTVIFRYDVGDLPYDSLAIQQSWDTSKRIDLTEPQGLATTTYYQPGYFATKLLVDGQVVREKGLYIPTQGWRGSVLTSMDDFTYLKSTQLRHDSLISVTPDVLMTLNEMPESALYLANLTDQPQIDGTHFDLATEFRLAQPTEQSICQQVRFTVTGTDEVLSFHFSTPGCVGDLMFMLNKEMISGRNYDLTAFGLDMSQWNRCRMSVRDSQLRVVLNDQEVFRHTLASSIGRVGGVQWIFEGMGEVRRLEIEDKAEHTDLMALPTER